MILLAFAACKSDYTAPCRNPVVTDSFVFSSAQLRNIPYSAQDTVLYVSDAGDSMLFMTSSYVPAPVIRLSGKPGNPECPNDYISYGALNVTLQDALHGTTLYFAAGRINDSCTYAVSGSGAIGLSVGAVGATDSTFADSVYLSNRVFYNVNRFANIQGDSFYISGSLGLLQFKQNAKRFTLQQFNSR